MQKFSADKDACLYEQELPVRAMHRSIVVNPWAKEWMQTLGQAEIYPQVLARGRSLLRKLQVSRLKVFVSKAEAEVCGHRASICFANQADATEEILAHLNLSEILKLGSGQAQCLHIIKNIFPDFGTIRSSCDCTEDTMFCSHGAAILYSLMSIFDEDCELMLQFIGVDCCSDRFLQCLKDDTQSDDILSEDEIVNIFNI